MVWKAWVFLILLTCVSIKGQEVQSRKHYDSDSLEDDDDYATTSFSERSSSSSSSSEGSGSDESDSDSRAESSSQSDSDSDEDEDDEDNNSDNSEDIGINQSGEQQPVNQPGNPYRNGYREELTNVEEEEDMKNEIERTAENHIRERYGINTENPQGRGLLKKVGGVVGKVLKGVGKGAVKGVLKGAKVAAKGTNIATLGYSKKLANKAKQKAIEMAVEVATQQMLGAYAEGLPDPETTIAPPPATTGEPGSVSADTTTQVDWLSSWLVNSGTTEASVTTEASS